MNNNSVLGGLVVGLALFIGSFVLLWWNEGNSAKNIATALYMQKKAVAIESSKIENTYEGSLVALAGAAVTDSLLRDMNIKLPNTLVLVRTVEMYQWEEKEYEDSNDNKHYEYNKIWSGSKINSDSFHDKQYKNPDFPIKTESFYADNAKLGAFDLTSMQIEKIRPEKQLYDLPENAKYSIENGKYYSGKDIQAPEIGDILISYSYAPSGTNISFIGKQQSNHIVSFNHKNRENYVQYNGFLSKEAIIEKYRQENRILTISLRFLGWFLMFIGLNLLVSPITKIFNFIPIIGNIANNITSFILMLISLILTLITIAIAWFAYRPVISIILISASLGITKIIKDRLPSKINEN